MGDLVLITGTSSGIGLAAAVACAAAGHRVIATMRNLDRRHALETAVKDRGATVHVEQLDVCSESAPRVVAALIEKYGPIFALVNNAGIAVGAVFEEQSDRDIRDQFDTNVVGLMTVTRAVLPAMRAARRGRIINLSSVSGRVGFPGVSIYAATKHAIEGFSEALRFEVHPFGIDVCLVEPGTFRTAIYSDNLRHGEHFSREGPYGQRIKAIERHALESAKKAPPPDEVARVIVSLIQSKKPPLRTLVGADARALTVLRWLLPDRWFVFGLHRMLDRLALDLR